MELIKSVAGSIYMQEWGNHFITWERLEKKHTKTVYQELHGMVFNGRAATVRLIDRCPSAK